jgi:hypothetical protein
MRLKTKFPVIDQAYYSNHFDHRTTVDSRQGKMIARFFPASFVFVPLLLDRHTP